MKTKKIWLMTGAFLLAITTGQAHAALITATNSTGGWADGNFIDRSVNIASTGTILNVTIEVAWSKCSQSTENAADAFTDTFFCSSTAGSPFPEEAYMYLRGPSGTQIELFPLNHFSGPSQSIDVTNSFDDDAELALPTTIQSGTFRPVGLLADFDGTDVFGTWTLRIGDWIGSDPTLFRSFTLNVTTEHANVPAPGALALFGLGLVSLGFLRRRRRS